jgi:hypothetical protein
MLMRTMTAVSTALLLCVAAAAANAADPAKFFGKYKGEVTTTVAAKPADVGSKRESTVDIKAAPETGFLVYWTTEFLARPAGPDKVRATSLHFLPTTNANVWRSERTGDPLYGQALIWAQVLDKSMTIYATIVPKEGHPVMTIYRRTLNGDDLALEYERIEDGKRTTVVTGTLKKEKN